MQNQLIQNRRNKSTDSVEADAVLEHLEVEVNSRFEPIKNSIKALLDTFKVETVTYGATAALEKAISDNDCYKNSSLKVLAVTWNVAGYTPKNSFDLREFTSIFQRDNLP